MVHWQQPLSSAALCFMLALISWLYPEVCYIQRFALDGMQLEYSFPLQIPSAACQRLYLNVTLSQVTLILSGTRHYMGDLSFYMSKSLYLYKTEQFFFFFSWQDFLDFHVTRYMFIWVKSENLGVFFPAVQGISKQISHLMQPLVVKLDMFTLYSRKYSPSTHEGLFLVVPATFPGRQEHLTVCDRSSIRFLLQHLWAAITSHVPPSDKEEEETEKKRH